MDERMKRFVYKETDLERADNQCKDCRFNEDKPLSCSCYTLIPNGTRCGRIKCPNKETIKKEE